jgi:hypothetical protein
MSNKIKRDSPLVKSILALDNYLAELERVGGRINATDMTSDFDVEYIQKLMTRFAECGQGVAEQVTNLSSQLQEAQERADVVAQGVSKQAELFRIRRDQQNEKLEEFRLLGEKVRGLNAAISELRPRSGNGLTDADRAKFAANIPGVEGHLSSLIEELENLRQSARDSKMSALEKNAGSLIQTLQSVRKKLRDLSSR